MSKVWKKPIKIPAGVTITIDGDLVKVTGPKWTLEQSIQYVSLDIKDDILTISSTDPEKTNYRWLYRALVQNMVTGVSDGFEKKLLVYGVGYAVKDLGKTLEFSLGLSHKKKFEIPQGITYKLEKDSKNNDIIVLSSHDKQFLWQICDKIKSMKKVEPYKGTGIRFVDEYIKLKPGKAAAK